MSKLITAAKLLFPISLGLLAAGCGSPDFKYGCEQSLACATSTGGLAIDVDTCVELNEAIYDELSGDEQSALSDRMDACKDKTGCDYQTCVSGE